MTSGPAPGTPIVLVGMMGAGKSAIGRRLARRLGWELLDSDRQVEALAGRRVPEIFDEDGEEAFRRLESQVLADALASPRPRVIAAAGGVVLDEANRRLLRSAGRVVWLRAPVETLTARVRQGEGRPLLRDDPGGTLRRLDAERRPLYEEVADITVDVDNEHGPGEVADAILRLLGLDRPGSRRRHRAAPSGSPAPPRDQGGGA